MNVVVPAERPLKTNCAEAALPIVTLFVASLLIIANVLDIIHPNNSLVYAISIGVIGFVIYTCYRFYHNVSKVHKTLCDKITELEAKLTTEQNKQSEQLR